MARRRRTTAGLVLLATAALGVAPSYAADGDGGSSAITAALTAGSIGSRSVTTVSPVALTSALNSSALTGSFSVLVTEAARSGTNAWSVTTSASSLTSGSNTLTADNLAISARSVTPVGGGGTSSAPTGSQTLDSARTLFSNAGQATTGIYTGTYLGSSTVTLTVPNGATTGAYTGTMTVTLVQ
jgi:hypothetical protein